MSDKLIEIAKQNGADIYLAQKGEHVYPCGAYLSTEQLRATVKQVCAPLVAYAEALECLELITGVESQAYSALKAYRAIMGDRHECV